MTSSFREFGSCFGVHYSSVHSNHLMSTIFTHPLVPITIGVSINALTSWRGQSSLIPTKLIALGCLFAVLPDLDVIGFELGVSYWSEFGHRGFTHSIFFAFVSACLVSVWLARYEIKATTAIVFLTISMASHGLLDSMTYGGIGVAFWWPIDHGREFFPWRNLPVSPIGVRRFFNPWGMYVMKRELYLIWLPLGLCMAVSLLTGRYLSWRMKD